MLTDNGAPQKETWDKVAESYAITIDEGEYELAYEIADVLEKHGIKPGAKTLELGCGSGHLSAVLAMKGYKTTLLDFSDTSIEKAKQTYTSYNIDGEFVCADILHINETEFDQYDLIWNSGVMEHFNNDDIVKAFNEIKKFNASKMLILVPNPESLSYLLMRYVRMAKNDWPYGEEYLRDNFGEIISSIGYQNIEKVYLGNSITKHCFNVALSDSLHADSFGMLMDNGLLPDRERYLVGYFASAGSDVDFVKSNLLLRSETENTTKFFNLNAEIYGLKMENKRNVQLVEEKSALIKELELLINEKQSMVNENQSMINEKQSMINEKQSMINEKQSIIREQEAVIIELKKANAELSEISTSITKDVQDLKDKNSSLAEQCASLTSEKSELENANALARTQCYNMARGKLFKLVHGLYRFKMQFVHGGLSGKRDFLKWLFNRTSVYNDHSYNPLYHIIKQLETQNPKTAPSISADIRESEDEEETYNNLDYSILNEKYSKHDVIVLSIIDYNFRFQRPQHFAQLFAQNGHRVFYINANHHHTTSDTVEELQHNLYNVNFANSIHTQIYNSDWSDQKEELFSKIDTLVQTCFIRDAVVVVEYPNWILGAKYFRDKYGFKIMTDYLDDFTGFINPNTKTVRDNCIKLLGLSDFVIASSQFLYDIAVKYNNKIGIVRNGTEYEHFYSVFDFDPHNERRVVGYYGAVAEWFDVEKVCFAAEHLQECDFVIIGEVTAGKDKFEKYKNIKLLGEQPYKTLPDYLKTFDVCLIPFDTSTDLIKATNPVKFYEYLSAGKKVVATNIPELLPYKDKYVYLADTSQEFLDAIKLCLDRKDTLASKQECADFALNNSWKARFNDICGYIKSSAPMVSIIVLTYNNLNLNKLCIDSILNNTAYPNYELIIVDNNSTDGTREYLTELNNKEIEFVKIHLNDENSGFAGGNNKGIMMSSGDYVLLLNNDTIVSRGWITGLVRHMEQDRDLGMIGPVTNSIGNEAKINAKYSGIGEMNRFAYNYTMKHLGEQFKDLKSLPMFCTMIKKEVIDSCGLLDENYKVGMFEDDDYAEAVKKCGFRLAIAEDSFVHHFDGGSFKSLDDDKYRSIFESNKKFFETKWNTKWKPHKYRDGVDASYNGKIKVEN